MNSFFIVMVFKIIKFPTFIMSLLNNIKLPDFIINFFNIVKLAFLTVIIISKILINVILKFKSALRNFTIFRYRYKKNKKYILKIKLFKFFNKKKKNLRDITDYLYLPYPIIVNKFKRRKVRSLNSHSMFNFEDAVTVNLEPFFDPIRYWYRRKFWKNLYYRSYPDNFFPINLKPFIDKPSNKSSFCEKFRENEWKLVTFTNDFIFVLDEFWEFDHGCAVHSWNIEKCPKILDVVKDHFYDDEERLWHFAEHLYELSSEDNFFHNRPLVEPNEF